MENKELDFEFEKIREYIKYTCCALALKYSFVNDDKVLMGKQLNLNTYIPSFDEYHAPDKIIDNGENWEKYKKAQRYQVIPNMYKRYMIVKGFVKGEV
jgi:hypothetical protein